MNEPLDDGHGQMNDMYQIIQLIKIIRELGFTASGL